MRVIVAGPRRFDDIEFVREQMNLWSPRISEVVTGMATGVDSIAYQLAKDANRPIAKFPADWQDFTEPCRVKTGRLGRYNALAGFKRNRAMAAYADGLLAIDCGTPGTRDMIKTAREMNLVVRVVPYIGLY